MGFRSEYQSLVRIDHIVAGLLWMFFGGVLFSFMGVFIKKLTPVLPTFEILFFRSLLTFAFFLVPALFRRRDFFPRKKEILIIRGVAGFGALACFIYAIAHLPLSIAVLLHWCSPLFVILFSRIFLGEMIGANILLWVIGALVGLVCLLLPVGEAASAVPLPLSAIWIGLLSAAIAGLALTAVRAATAHFSTDLILLYFSGASILGSVAPMAFDYVSPTLSQWADLFAVSVLASLAQLCVTQGYRVVRAGVASAMGLMNVAFSSLWGILFFGEALAFFQWVGLTILALSIFAIAAKGRPRKST